MSSKFLDQVGLQEYTKSIKRELSKKANTDGYYVTLHSGLSDNMVDMKGEGVEQSFTFRTAYGSQSIDNDGYAVIKSIHGNTIKNNNKFFHYLGTGIKTIGFNCLNNGIAILLGNNQYQITGSYTSLSYKDIYGTVQTITPSASGLFTPTNDGTLTVTGYSSDTCVHFTWSGYRNGEYESYWEYTLNLPIIDYFPTGMKSAKLVYDELTSTKSIQRIREVDASDLTWTETSSSVYTALIPDIRPNTTNIVSEKYNQVTVSGNKASITSNIVPTGKIVYEIEVPIETFVALNLTYPVSDFGTEEALPNELGEVFAPFIGEIKYSVDYVRMLENLPENYQAQKSMDNLLTVLGNAIGGNFSKTWDVTNNAWTYQFTPIEH